MITSDLTILYLTFPIFIVSVTLRAPSASADGGVFYGGLHVLPDAADAAPGLQASPVG
jgi:hypothetical protein